MPLRDRDDERNRFRAGFTADEMRELRDASDRIMRSIETIKTEVKSDIISIRSEIRAELAEVKAEVKATASTMIPRSEYEPRHKALEADIEDLKKRADASFAKWVSGAALAFSALSAIAVTVGLIAQHWH